MCGGGGDQALHWSLIQSHALRVFAAKSCGDQNRFLSAPHPRPEFQTLFRCSSISLTTFQSFLYFVSNYFAVSAALGYLDLKFEMRIHTETEMSLICTRHSQRARGTDPKRCDRVVKGPLTGGHHVACRF